MNVYQVALAVSVGVALGSMLLCVISSSEFIERAVGFLETAVIAWLCVIVLLIGRVLASL